MKRKTKTSIYWSLIEARKKQNEVEASGKKVTLWRKLYDESKGHYYELTYTL